MYATVVTRNDIVKKVTEREACPELFLTQNHVAFGRSADFAEGFSNSFFSFGISKDLRPS